MTESSITFVVVADSSETMRVAKLRAIVDADLERTHTGTMKAGDRILVEKHRLGDFFDAVDIAEQDNTSFQIVFRPRPGAGSYWMDIAVGMLGALRAPGVSITSAKRFTKKT